MMNLKQNGRTSDEGKWSWWRRWGVNQGSHIFVASLKEEACENDGRLIMWISGWKTSEGPGPKGLTNVSWWPARKSRKHPFGNPERIPKESRGISIGQATGNGRWKWHENDTKFRKNPKSISERWHEKDTKWH